MCYALLLDYCSAEEYPPKNLRPLEPEQANQTNSSTGGAYVRTTSAVKPEGTPPNGNSGMESSHHTCEPIAQEPGRRIEGSNDIGDTFDATPAIELQTIRGNLTAPYTGADDHSLEENRRPADVPNGVKMKLAESRWFTRGWTLQELIAPIFLLFYDYNGAQFGGKRALAQDLADITGVEVQYLRGEEGIHAASVSCRMSWASKRQTTRKEDIAYCLLGILEPQFPARMMFSGNHLSGDEFAKGWRVQQSDD